MMLAQFGAQQPPFSVNVQLLEASEASSRGSSSNSTTTIIASVCGQVCTAATSTRNRTQHLLRTPAMPGLAARRVIHAAAGSVPTKSITLILAPPALGSTLEPSPSPAPFDLPKKSQSPPASASAAAEPPLQQAIALANHSVVLRDVTNFITGLQPPAADNSLQDWPETPPFFFACTTLQAQWPPLFLHHPAGAVAPSLFAPHCRRSRPPTAHSLFIPHCRRIHFAPHWAHQPPSFCTTLAASATFVLHHTGQLYSDVSSNHTTQKKSYIHATCTHFALYPPPPAGCVVAVVSSSCSHGGVQPS